MDEKQDTSESLKEVLKKFEIIRGTLDDCCVRTRELIEQCLAEENIRFQSIQARVKSVQKLEAKYTNPNKNYARLEDITDLAGIRIITYYSDEVDAVASVIEREFDVDKHNSHDRRSEDPSKFGYHAINLVCKHSKKRLKNVEYKRFQNIAFEIQITSILRHTWAEIEHDWYDMRDSTTFEIKRRFSRLDALLELAEAEFLDLRKKRDDLLKSVSVRMEANISETPIDLVSLSFICKHDALIAEIDKEIVKLRNGELVSDGLDRYARYVLEIIKHTKISSIAELLTSLKEYRFQVLEFVKKIEEISDRPKDGRAFQTGICLGYLGFLLIAKESGAEGLKAFCEKASGVKDWVRHGVHDFAYDLIKDT